MYRRTELVREDVMEEFWKLVSKNKDKIRFVQAESYSPYSEFSVKGKKELSNGVLQLSVNSFYRYDSIMQPLFTNSQLSEKHKEWLFDIYMHYLTELEYRTGMTYLEYQVRSCMQDLLSGQYGKKIQETYKLLDEKDAYSLAHMLYLQRQTQESIEKFTSILVDVLHNGIVYKNEMNEKELYLYLSEKEENEKNSIIDMIKQLFMPLGYELRVFWEQHFAVIGENQTMHIDEIEIL